MELLKIEIPIPIEIKHKLDQYDFDYQRNTIDMLKGVYYAIIEQENMDEKKEI